MEKLAHIFENATNNLEARHQNNIPTSSIPTTLANIRKAPRVHQRITQNNIPGIFLTEEQSPQASEGGKHSEDEQKIEDEEEPRSSTTRQRTHNKPISAIVRQSKRNEANIPIQPIATTPDEQALIQ